MGCLAGCPLDPLVSLDGAWGSTQGPKNRPFEAEPPRGPGLCGAVLRRDTLPEGGGEGHVGQWAARLLVPCLPSPTYAPGEVFP